jgi:hypothetical protein
MFLIYMIKGIWGHKFVKQNKDNFTSFSDIRFHRGVTKSVCLFCRRLDRWLCQYTLLFTTVIELATVITRYVTVIFRCTELRNKSGKWYNITSIKQSIFFWKSIELAFVSYTKMPVSISKRSRTSRHSFLLKW